MSAATSRADALCPGRRSLPETIRMSRDGQALLLLLADRPVDGISQITAEFAQFRRDLSQHPQILMPAQMLRQIFQEPDPDVGAAATKLCSYSRAVANRVRELKQFLFERLYRHPRLMAMSTESPGRNRAMRCIVSLPSFTGSPSM